MYTVKYVKESNHSYANNETDVTKYVYDNNGNQIKKIGYTTKGVNGSPSQDLVSENELNNTYEMYKYNEFNEMTSFESNKEAVWYYAYLPNGLRYRKHKNNYNNSDWFVWDRNGNIIAEMNNNKEYTNKYVRGNKLISKNDNEYYSYDGHGSVVNISNESGKSIKSYDYDAFGVELNKDANDTNLFRYCGEQYDNETDSIYLRARYYSPSLGRFTTDDPAKDGDNWYSYCAGNPVNGWDPSGLFNQCTIIKEGDSNDEEDVKTLQRFLSKNKLLNANYTYGVYDKYTMQAVDKYKENNGIYNSKNSKGKVGITTWVKMGLDFDLVDSKSNLLARTNIKETAIKIYSQEGKINSVPTYKTAELISKTVLDVFRKVYSKDFNYNESTVASEIYGHVKIYQRVKDSHNSTVSNFLWEHTKEIDIGNKSSLEFDKFVWEYYRNAMMEGENL